MVQDAVHDCGVFTREARGRGFLLEQEYFRDRQNQLTYVVLGAGLPASDASKYFPHDRTRERRLRDLPLRLVREGRADLLLCLRPLEFGDQPQGKELMTSFLPAEKALARVALLVAHLRFLDLPANPLGVRSLRLEFDPSADRPPLEAWLRPWEERLEENPAHASVHLHVNTRDTAERTDPRSEESDSDLRLAVGFMNPLVTILSVATWYRRICVIT